MDIKNKVSLITGAARIGRVIAISLAERGSHIVLTYNRSKEIVHETITEVQRCGVKGLAIKADLTRGEEGREVVGAIIEECGRIDVVVNMASVYEQIPFEEITLPDLDRNLAVHLEAPFLIAQAVAPHMRRQGQGKIINFADWLPASHRPRYKNQLAYYVSKAAAIALTESLALELAPEITVNCIAPGPILKPEDLTEEEDLEVVTGTPLRRWGKAEEIAQEVIALIEGDFRTGECIRVDGGRHLL